MALSAQIFALPVGHLGWIPNVRATRRSRVLGARPVTPFASDARLFEGRIVVPVHGSRDLSGSARMTVPAGLGNWPGCVKACIPLIARREVPARVGGVIGN